MSVLSLRSSTGIATAAGMLASLPAIVAVQCDENRIFPSHESRQMSSGILPSFSAQTKLEASSRVGTVEKILSAGTGPSPIQSWRDYAGTSVESISLLFSPAAQPALIDLSSMFVGYAAISSQTNPLSLSIRSAGTLLAETIENYRLNEQFDDAAAAVASSASADAKHLVQRANLGGAPYIIFSEDGALSLQWQRGEVGVALVFVGDGTASIAFRRPGQLYAENGIEVGISDNLPSQFNDVLATILI